MHPINNFIPIGFRDRVMLFSSWFCVVFFGLAAVLVLTGIRQVVANSDAGIQLVVASSVDQIEARVKAIDGVDAVQRDLSTKRARLTVTVSPVFWLTDKGINQLKHLELDPSVETLSLPAPQTRSRVRVLGAIWMVALGLTFCGVIFAMGLTFILLRASIRTNAEYLELMRRFGTSTSKLKREAWAGSINTGVFSGVVITFALVALLMGLQGFLMQVEDVTPLSAWFTWPLVTAPVWLIPLVFTGASTWATREIIQ